MIPDVVTEAAKLVRADPALEGSTAQRQVVAELLDSFRNADGRTYAKVEQLRALLSSIRGHFVARAFDRVGMLCDAAPKSHDEIVALANPIVSELRAQGWSDEGLLELAATPASTARAKLDTVREQVGRGPRLFDCYVALSGPTNDIAAAAKEAFEVVSEAPGDRPRRGRSLSDGPFARAVVEAFDPYSAAIIAHVRVQSVVGALAVFIPRKGLRVSGSVVAVASGADLLVVDTEHPLEEENRSAPKGELVTMVSAAWSASERPAADPLYDAIRLRHRAQTSGDAETRLLLLWSAIERITSGARGFGGALSASKTLTAKAIALGKLRRDVGDLAAAISHTLTENELAPVLKLIGGYRDANGRPQIDRTKLLHRMLGARTALDELLGLFYDDHPLLVRRCFSLWSELGGNSPDNRTEAIATYHENARQRVEWQIGRIYRARNRIAHVGVAPDRVRDLAWHAHFYCTQLVAICVHYDRATNIRPQAQLPQRAGMYDAFIALLRSGDATAVEASVLMRPTSLFDASKDAGGRGRAANPRS